MKLHRSCAAQGAGQTGPQTVRPEVLVILGFGHYMTPVSKELGLPNPSELEKIDVRLISPDGSSSEHTIVKIYKV